MKKIDKTILTVALALTLALPSIAAISSEPAALDMLKKAAAQYKALGADAAKAEFNKPGGDYVNGSVYLYCVGNADHKMNVHPVNKALLGVDVFTLKDSDNFEFGKAIMATAKAGKVNTVDYKWPNPATKTIGEKRAYFENFGTDTCVVGVYKD